MNIGMDKRVKARQGEPVRSPDWRFDDGVASLGMARMCRVNLSLVVQPSKSGGGTRHAIIRFTFQGSPFILPRLGELE